VRNVNIALLRFPITKLLNYKFLMIFGFNTDVKHGDTIYHVQSEAREGELLLQTQVFVRGRCIGKKAVSYAEWTTDPKVGDTRADSEKEQRLREQHRDVLEAIREGKLENVLDHPEPETLAGVKELEVQWLNAGSIHHDRNLTMQLRVTEGGSAAPGARLVFRFARPDAAPFYTQAVADAAGGAEIKVEVEESALPDSSVLVQANYEGRTATRKFLLRKAE
jgi:hypothetical protein